MIRLQALSNNEHSIKDRQKTASVDDMKPIGIYLANYHHNESTSVQGIQEPVMKLSLTIVYRRGKTINSEMVIYSYLSDNGMLMISLGMLQSQLNFKQDILGLDDESKHRLISLIIYHWFDFSPFMGEQAFYINIGRAIRLNDGYKTVDQHWFFGTLNYITRLAHDTDRGHNLLYYDGTNVVTLNHDIKEIEELSERR